jgi:predicted AlkP superfamily phosphohydrolase/phosphomutase
MAASIHKTLVIGLELGDGQLLHTWAKDGKLPAIQSLMNRGCWGWLETTADLLHISAWPSIYTGASPGEHGVYFTFQPAPGLQGYQRFHTGIYGRPTLWKLLDQAGRKCTVFDPPYAHPEQGFGGTLIYDWGSWAHYLQPGSTPEGMLKQLEMHCGRYPLGIEANDLGWGALQPAATKERLLVAIKSKASATRWLMQQSDWDLLVSVFGETHVAGHYCLQDAASASAESQPLMLEIYQELDRAIAMLCEAAGPDATVIIISGDRVAPNHAGWHLLPEVLARLGYLANGSAPSSVGAQAGSLPRKRLDPVKVLRDLLPKNFRKSLARMLPTALRDKLAQRVDTADTDWSRTRVYCLPTDLEGYLRVNLRGREPQGIVTPGTEYETLLSGLRTALMELRDPTSGEAIVREVIRTDEAFPGDRQDWLPDLIVRWNGQQPITGATSLLIGTVTSVSPDLRPGTHAGPGFVLAAGPGIVPAQELKQAHILDFAPTVLTRLGVAVPAHMLGRVWTELNAA